MDLALALVVASFALAALLGASGPAVMRRLPEPTEPAKDKIAYAVLADTRLLAPSLALAAGVMAATVAARIEHPELMPAWIVIAGVGSWLAFIDWHTRLLPFALVAPTYLVTMVLVALGALFLRDARVLTDALVANIAVYVIFRLLYWLAGRFFGGAFGYGDVRLSGVLSLALGSLGGSETVVGMYAGFILGAVFGVVLSRLRILDAGGYAFGPYMVVGAILGAAWGPALY